MFQLFWLIGCVVFVCQNFRRFRDIHPVLFVPRVCVVVLLLGDFACLNLVYMACFVLGRHLFVSIAIIFESIKRILSVLC